MLDVVRAGLADADDVCIAVSFTRCSGLGLLIDPLNALAFESRRWPFGASLNAIYGSDIGHFDVPSLPDVLVEAWENVERGWMDEEQFRRFTFDHAARFYVESNPRFFEGTAVAGAVARLAAR